MFNLCFFYQGTPNEQLHVNSAECMYSCDIYRSERLYTCDVCNKAFTQKGTLVRHLRAHSVEMQ